MRILVALHHDPNSVGGSQSHARALWKELDRQGNVAFLTSADIPGDLDRQAGRDRAGQGDRGQAAGMVRTAD